MSDHFYIYIHCVLSIARVTSLSLFMLCVCVTYRIPQLVFLQFILIIFLMRSYFHFSFFSSFIPTRDNHICKKVVKLERFALCKQICLLFFFFSLPGAGIFYNRFLLTLSQLLSRREWCCLSPSLLTASWDMSLVLKGCRTSLTVPAQSHTGAMAGTVVIPQEV